MGFGHKVGFLGSKDFKILSSNCQERFQHGLCKSSEDQKDTLKLKASSEAHIIITSMLSLSTHASLQLAWPHHTARSQAVSHTSCQSHRPPSAFSASQAASREHGLTALVPSHSTRANMSPGCHGPWLFGCTVLGISIGTRVMAEATAFP